MSTVDTPVISSELALLLAFFCDQDAEFQRPAAFQHMKAEASVTTYGFMKLWKAAKYRKWIDGRKEGFGYFYSVKDKARLDFAAFRADQNAEAANAEAVVVAKPVKKEPLFELVEPGAGSTEVAGFDVAMGVQHDAVECAGFLLRLADLLARESGNDNTCYMLNRSALHLEGLV